MDNALIGKPFHSSLVMRLEFTVVDGHLVGYLPMVGGQDVPVHLPAGYCFVVRFDAARKRPVLYIELDTKTT